jgi:hypothetical protein
MAQSEFMFDATRNKEVEIGRCVLDALELIMKIYEAADPKLVSHGQQGDSTRQDFTAVEQLHSKPNRKLTESLFKVVWEMSVQRRYPVVLMARRFKPSALLMSVLFAASNVLPRNVFEGCIWEENFPILTATSVRIIQSPIRVFLTPQAAQFGAVLAGAQSKARHAAFFCDWRLEHEELDEALALSAGGRVKFMDANGSIG